MANGLLGKKLVNTVDTESVYTVPNAKVATFNFSILNNAATTSSVKVYLSSTTYQSADFANFTAAADSFASSYKVVDTIGHGLNTVYLSEQIPAAKVNVKKSLADHTAGTLTFSDQAATLGGEPLPFYNGTALYVREMYTGKVYTLDNFCSGGSATTAATNWTFTSANNILWTTNKEADNAVFYVKGGTAINTIADYRSTTNSYGTMYNIPFGGTITAMSGVKTNSERFLVGLSTGNLYWSSADNPVATGNWNTTIVTLPSGVLGTFIGGASDTTKVYAVFDSEKVAYNAYGSNDEPLTGWLSFDFPSGLDAANIVKVYHDGTSLCLLKDDFVIHKTSNLGVTWTTATNTAKQHVTLDVSSSKYRVQGIASPELEVVRGATYVFQQLATSNNGHPFSISTTANGTHGGGTAYSTGMTFNYGPPTATAEFTGTSTTYTDWTTNHATHNGAPRTIEWTVPSDAPDMMYTYCSIHSGMGFGIKVSDAPVQSGETWLTTQTIWADATGDATKKIDVFFDGTTTTRIKRFNVLNDSDLFDKVSLTAGEVLERTGVMASAGEQLLVTTTVDGMVVRAHGIEE